MHDDCFRGAIVLLPIKREDPSSLRFRTGAKSPVQIARSLTASVIRLNPAIRDRVKSGHRERQKTLLFYLANV